MAVGYQTNSTTLNNQLGLVATAYRDLSRQAVQLQAQVVALGADDTARAAALVTMGFTSGDATQMVYLASVANTLAQIYYGNAGQTPPFNFDNALSPAWGPR